MRLTLVLIALLSHAALALADESARPPMPCERGAANCHCPDDKPAPGALKTGPACFVDHPGRITPLPPDLRERMRTHGWRTGCPVPLDALSIVTVPHWDLEGQVREGQLVVSTRVAEDVRKAFQRLYRSRFPIARMETIDRFQGDDDASMAANNSSAFNCRPKKAAKGVSRHAYGEAIDLNPLMNPFVHGHKVEPPDGRKWLSREPSPGVIVQDGPAVKAFESIGWKWGGRWKRSKDYQHFSASGD